MHLVVNEEAAQALPQDGADRASVSSAELPRPGRALSAVPSWHCAPQLYFLRSIPVAHPKTPRKPRHTMEYPLLLFPAGLSPQQCIGSVFCMIANLCCLFLTMHHP